MAFSFTHIALFLLPKKHCSVGQGFAGVKVQKKSSLVVLALIFSLHLLVIFLMLNAKTLTELQSHESVVVFHLLQPEFSKPLQTIQPPNILYGFEREITRFPEPESIRIEINEELSGVAKNGYELPGQRDDGQQYENIFDPKMRKKLADNHHLNSRPLDSNLKSWTDSSGTQFVELGEGRCLKSMPKMFMSDRATSWSLPFKCGKDQGEKMMDNVNADLAARNRPMR